MVYGGKESGPWVRGSFQQGFKGSLHLGLVPGLLPYVGWGGWRWLVMVSAPFLADCLNSREGGTLHPMREDLDDEVLAVSS